MNKFKPYKLSLINFFQEMKLIELSNKDLLQYLPINSPLEDTILSMVFY